MCQERGHRSQGQYVPTGAKPAGNLALQNRGWPLSSKAIMSPCNVASCLVLCSVEPKLYYRDPEGVGSGLGEEVGRKNGSKV